MISLAIAVIISLAGYGAFTIHLRSQDTSFSGFLSGTMLKVWGGEKNQLIRVNLHNHSIALYQSGVLYKLAKIAAAGNPRDYTATPTGKFRILSKDAWHISSLSGVIMPWSLRFFQGYYFHDIPLTPAGAIINTKYSHGCIRLPTTLAREVFEWTRVGAYVEIYDVFLARVEDSTTVYFLTPDGFREPIANPEAFLAHGFHWEDVSVLPDQELLGLPLGPTIL